MGCKKIGIFVEDEWVSKSYFPILNELRGSGLLPLLITTNKDWDKGLRKSIPTAEDEPIYYLQADLSVEDVQISEFSGFIFGGGYWADRQRWWFSKTDAKGNLERPQVAKLVKDVLSIKDKPIGVICHSMWILCSFKSLFKGRSVTCAYNIIDDVDNAGFKYVDQDVVVDGNLVSGRMSDNSEVFIKEYIKQLTLIGGSI
jgi:putative intracellular protease/amidase